jgi:hypothetical protein
MWKRLVIICGVGLTVAACVPPQEPEVAAKPADLSIAAPFDRTWNAVVEHFAMNSIPIRTLDRSSGLIVTDDMRVPGKPTEQARWAVCSTGFGMKFGPTVGSYNVLIRGDSSKATVRVTARWEDTGRPANVCQTTGVYEGNLAAAIRQRAETK